MVAIPGPLVAEDSKDVLAELRKALGAKSDAQMIRKALSLARLAAQYADQDGNIVLTGENGEKLKIKLRG